ncbi:MAG: DUF1566 domain-containing protein [Pseudomonadota bacterium]
MNFKLHLPWVAILGLLACATQAQAQERFTPSADGQEVTDKKTGLTWKRCAEGMVWKVRTCTGTATFFTHTDATARAKAAGAEWRLPVLKELSSILALRDAEPGKAPVDAAVFPGTPMVRFWTATPVGPGYFTYVGFTDGSAGESPRNSPGAVRLVRGGS